MKKKIHALFFAAMVVVIGYLIVSTAAKHTEADNAALYQWWLNSSSRR